MKKVDYIIVGQGIAGILTAFNLINKGKTVFLFDDRIDNSASHIAGAVLNPINLRNGHLSFFSDSLNTALSTYRHLEQFLKISFLEEKSLIFSSENQIPNNPLFLDIEKREKSMLDTYFNSVSYNKKIKPVWQINNGRLLKEWRTQLEVAGHFREEQFQYADCIINKNEIIYKDIKASHLVFCEGVKGKGNPFFDSLTFTQNRGNVLLLSIPELSDEYIFHYKIRLIPLGNYQFWLGSNYQWKFENLKPDLIWQKEQLNHLSKWLKTPFSFVNHLVAERPTSEGQIPFLLQHKTYENVFFFNGLGTKGFTLGPYFAKQFLNILSI